MKKSLLFAAMLSSAVAATAQTEQFSIATLNVDGLPKKVLFLDTNPDGPGAEGSLRIGKYLAQQNFDLVFTQEDFNYHAELALPLLLKYNFDTWSGGVGILGHKIDPRYLQNVRFDCDGLGACWKKCVRLNNVTRTAWNDVFGKFSHANDELVTKGFRRYEFTLPCKLNLVVYNMHMDAGDDPDEMVGNDLKDREARRGQWKQLLDDILARMDNRPVLVLGDLNSYYCRDGVEQNFIDAINASGKGIANDVWVELQNDNVYPEPKESIVFTGEQGWELNGETLDKIIYINPTTGMRIKPLSFKHDKEAYQHDGKPLGDHYPLTATFGLETGFESIATLGIGHAETDSPTTATSMFDLSGRKMSSNVKKGLYIEHSGKDARKRIVR